MHTLGPISFEQNSYWIICHMPHYILYMFVTVLLNCCHMPHYNYIIHVCHSLNELFVKCHTDSSYKQCKNKTVYIVLYNQEETSVECDIILCAMYVRCFWKVTCQEFKHWPVRVCMWFKCLIMGVVSSASKWEQPADCDTKWAFMKTPS